MGANSVEMLWGAFRENTGHTMHRQGHCQLTNGHCKSLRLSLHNLRVWLTAFNSKYERPFCWLFTHAHYMRLTNASADALELIFHLTLHLIADTRPISLISCRVFPGLANLSILPAKNIRGLEWEPKEFPWVERVWRRPHQVNTLPNAFKFSVNMKSVVLIKCKHFPFLQTQMSFHSAYFTHARRKTLLNVNEFPLGRSHFHPERTCLLEMRYNFFNMRLLACKSRNISQHSTSGKLQM